MSLQHFDSKIIVRPEPKRITHVVAIIGSRHNYCLGVDIQIRQIHLEAFCSKRPVKVCKSYMKLHVRVLFYIAQ